MPDRTPNRPPGSRPDPRRRGARRTSSARSRSSAPAAERGAQIVCLQELFRSPLLLPDGGRRALRARRADPRPDDASALGERREEHGIVDRRQPLRAARRRPLPQHRGRARRRRPPSSGIYRKMHIPDDPRFYEKFYFTPGDLGFRAFDTRVRPHRRPRLLGPVVPRGGAPHRARGRGDPDLPHRHRHLDRARLRARARRQHDAWRTMQRATPSPTACFVVAVNRVGGEDDLDFWGALVRRRPTARVLAEAGDREEILVVPTATSREVERARAGLALPPRPPHRRLRRPHAALARRRPRAPRRPDAGAGFRTGTHPTPRRAQGYRWPAEWERARGDAGSPGRTIPTTWPAPRRGRARLRRVAAAVATGRARRTSSSRTPPCEAPRARRALAARGRARTSQSPPRRPRPTRGSATTAPSSWRAGRGRDARAPALRLPLQRVGRQVRRAPGRRRRFPRASAASTGSRAPAPDLVLEGGSIDGNGAGHACSRPSSACSTRTATPRSPRAEIEAYLRDYARRPPGALARRGHRRATTPTATWTTSRASWARATIVTAVEDGPERREPRAPPRRLRRLQAMADQEGRPLEVVDAADAARGLCAATAPAARLATRTSTSRNRRGRARRSADARDAQALRDPPPLLPDAGDVVAHPLRAASSRAWAPSTACRQQIPA